jgi:Ni,Fe-hydrogenase I large subunit
MKKTITIDPISRIEGHLAIHLDVESYRVKHAYSSGEMFRGFENILKGRDPMDAQQITQRICGVCPIAHGTASIIAQDNAYTIRPPKNGRLLRNLILGANYLQSHIIHFYQLAALDFIDITAITDYTGNDPKLAGLRDWVNSQLNSNVIFPAAPFLPRYEAEYLADTNANLAAINHYLQALEMRQTAHQAAALFCGKIPHATGLVPGGVTQKPNARNLAAYKSKIQKLLSFISTCYLPDAIAVATSFPEYFYIGLSNNNFLSYGVFAENDSSSEHLLNSGVLLNGTLYPVDTKKITEDVLASYFKSGSGLPPTKGETIPDPNKKDAYSWLKAPRYDKHAVEVGPLARILVSYASNNRRVVSLVDSILQSNNLRIDHLKSTMGRHVARALECKLVAERCLEWLEEVDPSQPSFRDFSIPATSQGVGLTEAPRGALGHWLEIENHKISRYQCIVPTTWNSSPRDDRGHPGPIEQSLVGTPVNDQDNPIEVTRVVRSFDPCIACAVH